MTDEPTVDTINGTQEDQDVDTELDDKIQKGTYVDFVGDGRRVKAVVIIPPNSKNSRDCSKTEVGYHALSIPPNTEMQPKECSDEVDIHTNGTRPDGVLGGSVFINERQDMEERYDGNTRGVKSKRDGKGYRYDYHCRHGKRKYRCKECGGSAFCFHGKERHRCNVCGIVCAHNIDRRVCEICVNRKKERALKKGTLLGQIDDDITDDEDDDYEYGGTMEGSSKDNKNLFVNQDSMPTTEADPMPGESGYRPSANNLVMRPNPEGVSLIFDWDAYTWISPKSFSKKHEDQSTTASSSVKNEFSNNESTLSSPNPDAITTSSMPPNDLY